MRLLFFEYSLGTAAIGNKPFGKNGTYFGYQSDCNFVTQFFGKLGIFGHVSDINGSPNFKTCFKQINCRCLYPLFLSLFFISVFSVNNSEYLSSLLKAVMETGGNFATPLGVFLYNMILSRYLRKNDRVTYPAKSFLGISMAFFL